MAGWGFAQNLISGEAFSQIEAELDSAIKDKDLPANSAGIDSHTSPPSENAIGRVHSDRSLASADGGAAGSSGALSSIQPHEQASDVTALMAKLRKLEMKLAEKTDLCSAKDEQIAATLKEGEELSIRQAEQEKMIRKLKQQASEAQQNAKDVTVELDETKAQLAMATRTLSEKESAAKGQTAEMRAEAAAASEAREAEREAERTQYAALCTKHEALEAEFHTLALALTQAEARDKVGAEALREVQAENARLIEASRYRDAGQTSHLGELEARTASAEEHAQQLIASMERATQPFRRQVEQLQAEQSQLVAQQQRLQQSKAALQDKLNVAEASAAAEKQRVREMAAALEALTERLSSEQDEWEAARQNLNQQVEASNVRAEEAQRAHAAQIEELRARCEAAEEAAKAASNAEVEANKRVAILEQELSDARSAIDAAAVAKERADNSAKEAKDAEHASAGPSALHHAPERIPNALTEDSHRLGVSDISAATLQTGVTMRQMANATARQQEGELLALRQQCERAELQQQLLIEQLTVERSHVSEQRGAILALQEMVAELGAVREQHAVALELLGEKQEELDAMRTGVGRSAVRRSP